MIKNKQHENKKFEKRLSFVQPKGQSIAQDKS